MSKKVKKILKIIIPIIIILAIIVTIIIVKNNSQPKVQVLLEVYNKLNGITSYQFQKEIDSKNKTIVAKNGNNAVIDNYSSGTHTTTIINNGTTTYISHEKEEYYIYNNINIEANIVESWMEDVINREYTTGEEKIRGKKYYYEEYQGSTMFCDSNSLNEDESQIKTRFYFDDENNLVYIKTIFSQTQEELLKIEISENIDNTLFEIPEGYIEISVD